MENETPPQPTPPPTDPTPPPAAPPETPTEPVTPPADAKPLDDTTGADESAPDRPDESYDEQQARQSAEGLGGEPPNGSE